MENIVTAPKTDMFRFRINPEIKKCLEYEELIDYKNMIYNAVKNEEIIKINYNQENEFSDIL